MDFLGKNPFCARGKPPAWHRPGPAWEPPGTFPSFSLQNVNEHARGCPPFNVGRRLGEGERAPPNPIITHLDGNSTNVIKESSIFFAVCDFFLPGSPNPWRDEGITHKKSNPRPSAPIPMSVQSNPA